MPKTLQDHYVTVHLYFLFLSPISLSSSSLFVDFTPDIRLPPPLHSLCHTSLPPLSCLCLQPHQCPLSVPNQNPITLVITISPQVPSSALSYPTSPYNHFPTEPMDPHGPALSSSPSCPSLCSHYGTSPLSILFFPLSVISTFPLLLFSPILPHSTMYHVHENIEIIT